MRFLSVPHLKITLVGGVFIIAAETAVMVHLVQQTHVAEAGLVLINWCDRYLRHAKNHQQHK